ncbi:MAG: iron(II)-dependent oxidoreductase [Planctomycetota bacterium]|jgi:iron(II)-dependent oxidoreductase
MNTGSYELIRGVQAAHLRTLALTDDLADSQLTVSLVESLNPFLWELGHVAFFCELFLLRELDGGELLIKNGNDLYNSFDVPHAERWELALPNREATRDYMKTVLSRVLERVKGRELTQRERYLYRMVANHEDMHGEAFTYMRQQAELSAPPAVLAGMMRKRPAAGSLPGDVEVPGGNFMLGADSTSDFAYDNEKWAHEVQVAPFRIARAPVTNEEFAAFVADEGYARQEFWSRAGWSWRKANAAQEPAYWRGDGSNWVRVNYDECVALEGDQPVSHVSYYEAEAYCRWAKRRLPSEAEWELAASGSPGPKRIYAWGDDASHTTKSNSGSQHGSCVDVADFAAGESTFGCRQMLGNVWEWTASEFYPFPGFQLDDPYKEYSAPWFGDRKVLRGGSWATQASLTYITYRNFFPPRRRDIISGFRTCQA